MNLHLGLKLGGRGGGASGVVRANLTGGSVDQLGAYAQIGTSIGYVMNWGINPPGTITGQTWRVGAGTVGTGTTYAPVGGDDLGSLTVEVATVEYGNITSSALTVRYAPGSAANALSPPTWFVGTPITPFDTTVDFTIPNLTGTYAGVNEPPGTAIDVAGVHHGTPSGLFSGITQSVFTDQYTRTVTSSYATLTADVPNAFTAGQWAAVNGGAGDILVTINQLPPANNDPITDIEYRLDGGSAVSSGGTGSFSITGLQNQTYAVQLRAVNGAGAGAWGDTKNVTVTGASTAAIITELVIGTQSGAGGDIPVDPYKIDKNSNVSWVLSTQLATQPQLDNATWIHAGQNPDGSPLTDGDSGVYPAVIGAVDDPVDVDDALSGDYHLYKSPEGSIVGTAATGNPVTISPPVAIIQELFDEPAGTILEQQPQWNFWFNQNNVLETSGTGYCRGNTPGAATGLKHTTPVTVDDYYAEANAQFANLGTTSRNFTMSLEVDAGDTDGFDIFVRADAGGSIRVSQWSQGELILLNNVGVTVNTTFTVRAELRRSTGFLRILFNGGEVANLDVGANIMPKATQFGFQYNTLTDGDWVRVYDLTVDAL